MAPLTRHIRPYTHADQPAVLTLLRLNTPRYFAPSEAADLHTYLTKHLEAYFVVTESDRIVGCGGINYFPNDRLARLSWDIIHPDFHGKGIGRQLTLYRIDRIREHPGTDRVVVRTSQLTHLFYQKMGFALEKVESNFWAPGYDLYQMVLPLGD